MILTFALILVSACARKGAPCAWARWCIPIAAAGDLLLIIAVALLLLMLLPPSDFNAVRPQ